MRSRASKGTSESSGLLRSNLYVKCKSRHAQFSSCYNVNMRSPMVIERMAVLGIGVTNDSAATARWIAKGRSLTEHLGTKVAKVRKFCSGRYRANQSFAWMTYNLKLACDSIFRSKYIRPVIKRDAIFLYISV